MAKEYVLDKERPFGRVRTHRSAARYAQDGQYYDHYGNHLGPEEGVPVAAPAVAEAPKAPQQQEVLKPAGNDALARAAAKMGAVPSVPAAVENAARENARALAAEDNA